jgi:hypothetical protein
MRHGFGEETLRAQRTGGLPECRVLRYSSQQFAEPFFAKVFANRCFCQEFGRPQTTQS